ncbi:unnamed protein product [Urochloa humidicola]
MSPYVLTTAAGVLIAFLYVVKNRRRGRLPWSSPLLPLIGHLQLIGRLAHRSLVSTRAPPPLRWRRRPPPPPPLPAQRGVVRGRARRREDEVADGALGGAHCRIPAG